MACMSTPQLNKTVLMSGTKYFGVEELNPYSHKDMQPDMAQAAAEHQAVLQALLDAGIDVIKVDEPAGCQDAVYTANWGLCRGDKVVLSSLPNKRQAEEAYAAEILASLGKQVIKPPYRFSGQGDALPCGNYLFCGSQYRTDPRMHGFLAETLGYEAISLQTVPELDAAGQPVTNRITGWPDSFFYDIDLALAVISPELIAWCPSAFTTDSQQKIKDLNLEKIEVSLDEAMHGFACNLVSTGEIVIMSKRAPRLQAALEAHGLVTITPEITELAKGGGYIRCTTLTLDND
jgi:N-dimethylarginine dimethylaminohydrolase